MSSWSASVLKALHIPNIMHQDVPNPPTEYYTCQFKKSKIENFLKLAAVGKIVPAIDATRQ
ncbi:hypothetical protein X801_08640 [Opisthorchis viverrini]|uniref:Uncharacterized protein n=1 Tax=Opisthorchis viverrini TaxID=6198 RepID=A0A1S8WM87_OPIVI|nr:hypothetical protein X801_08640 [Opisthorchis viverrini]